MPLRVEARSLEGRFHLQPLGFEAPPRRRSAGAWTFRAQLTTTREKGLGIMNLSQERSSHALSGRA